MTATALASFITTPRVAYLTMEIALRNDFPTYSGHAAEAYLS